MISPNIHVPNSSNPKLVTFCVVKPPTKPLTLSPTTPAPWLKNNSIPSRLEYENPDLTQPSVSSF
jgi:hypothetical protein